MTNPYELIKIRQQTIHGQPISETIRELGLRGLTQGLGACLLRDIPFNVLYFSSYAMLKDVQKSKEQPDAPLSPGSLMAAGLGAGLVAGGLTTPAGERGARVSALSSSLLCIPYHIIQLCPSQHG